MANVKYLNFKILTAVILTVAILSPIFLNIANAQEEDYSNVTAGDPRNAQPSAETRANAANTATAKEMANQNAAADTAKNTGGILGTISAIMKCFKDSIIDCLLQPFLWLVQAFFAFFIEIAAMLVNLSFAINKSLGQAVVITGWNITNALANLGFVLFIIIIAFATVVRWPGYGLKDILWKLIAAALLVNFSLLIAFVFIDFSNVLSEYFLNAATKGQFLTSSANIGGALANSFRIQTMQRIQPVEGSAANNILPYLSSGLNVMIIKAISIFIQIIFNFVIVCTFLALAAAMMVRFVVLSMLLILAPMAWLLWIIPATSKYWHEWWDKFIKWVFFAPAMAFFIYLALAIPQQMQLDSLSKAASTGMANTSFIADLFVQVGNMVVIVGLLMGGMMTANKMGIAAAATGYAIGSKLQKAAGGYVGKRALTLGAKPAKPAEGGKPEQEEKPSYAQRFATRISGWKVPGAKIAASYISNKSENLKQDVDKKYKERFENLSKDSLENQAKSILGLNKIPGAVDPITLSALTKAIADKGITSRFSDEQLEILTKNSLKTGTTKELLAIMPKLAPLIGQTYEKAISYQRPGQAEKMDYRNLDFNLTTNKGLEDLRAAQAILLNQNYSNGHLARVAQEGSADLKNNIEKVLIESIKQFQNETGKSFDQITQADLTAKGLPATSQKQFEQLQRMRKASRENVNLQGFVPQAEKEKK